jgi:hypothetical protein
MSLWYLGLPPPPPSCALVFGSPTGRKNKTILTSSKFIIYRPYLFRQSNRKTERRNVNDLYKRRDHRASGMTAPLVPLHVAADTEGLPAAHMGASEGLLARVTVGMDSQTGRPREGLVAGPADVSVMILGIWRGAGRREIVVVLPRRVPGRDHRWSISRWRDGGRRAVLGLSRVRLSGRREGAHTRGGRAVGPVREAGFLRRKRRALRRGRGQRRRDRRQRCL